MLTVAPPNWNIPGGFPFTVLPFQTNGFVGCELGGEVIAFAKCSFSFQRHGTCTCDTGVQDDWRQQFAVRLLCSYCWENVRCWENVQCWENVRTTIVYQNQELYWEYTGNGLSVTSGKDSHSLIVSTKANYSYPQKEKPFAQEIRVGEIWPHFNFKLVYMTIKPRDLILLVRQAVASGVQQNIRLSSSLQHF